MTNPFKNLSALAFAIALTVPANAQNSPPAPPALKTARVQIADITRYVTLPGTLRADQQVTLYAKVAGYLKSIRVDRGDAVKAGDLLAEIETPELLADMARYEAELRVAEADFQRISSAQKKAPDLVISQTVDETQGRLEIAKANLLRTRTMLEFSHLTAPFPGVITARYVDPGSYIPAATSGKTPETSAIVTLMDFSKVRAVVPVPEVEASLVAKGQPVLLQVAGFPDTEFSGTVSRHSFALDEATRTLLVEADLPNPELKLRPGMFAMTRIGVETHRQVLSVPAAAILQEKSGASAFLVRDGKSLKTPVTIGFNDGQRIEIVKGVAENDPVILLSGPPPADGTPVSIAP